MLWGLGDHQDTKDMSGCWGKGFASTKHLPPSPKCHPSKVPGGDLIYLSTPWHCCVPLQSQIQLSVGLGGTRPPSSPSSMRGDTDRKSHQHPAPAQCGAIR